MKTALRQPYMKIFFFFASVVLSYLCVPLFAIAQDVGKNVEKGEASLQDSGIRFVIDNPIDDYRISGFWFPDGVLNYGRGLSGTALFRIINLKSGDSFQVLENGMALLNKTYFVDHKVDPENLSETDEPVTLLGSEKVLHLKYSAVDRATVKHDAKSKYDFLKFGNVPVDIQIIDFSTKPKFIFAHPGAGQRFVTSLSMTSLIVQGMTLLIS